MIVATIVILVLLCLTFVFDFIYINNPSFRSRFESNRLVNVLSGEAVKVVSSETSNPNIKYLGRRYMGIVALVMCIAFIVFRIQIYS